MLKTNDEEKSAKGLEFLLKTGLLINEKRRSNLTKFLADRKPGDVPVLAQASFVPQRNVHYLTKGDSCTLKAEFTSAKAVAYYASKKLEVDVSPVQLLEIDAGPEFVYRNLLMVINLGRREKPGAVWTELTDRGNSSRLGFIRFELLQAGDSRALVRDGTQKPLLPKKALIWVNPMGCARIRPALQSHCHVAQAAGAAFSDERVRLVSERVPSDTAMTKFSFGEALRVTSMIGCAQLSAPRGTECPSGRYGRGCPATVKATSLTAMVIGAPCDVAASIGACRGITSWGAQGRGVRYTLAVRSGRSPCRKVSSPPSSY
jgi:hypothetical protein